MKIAGIEIPGLDSDTRMLDIGCGLGWAVKEATAQGMVGFGMDISFEQLVQAKEVLKNSLEEKQSLLLQGAVSQIPLGCGKFNLVICCETIEHVEAPELLLSEINRVLAPNGFVIISFPVKRVEKIISFFCDYFLEFSGHVRQFYPEEMKRLIEHHGFKIIKKQQRYFEWSLYYFWMAVFRMIPKVDRRGNRYGISAGQEKFELFYKRIWSKLIQWKIGLFLLWLGNRIFPKSYIMLIQKNNSL